MGVFILILLLGTSSPAQEVDLQPRPEAIYVESIQGNIVPIDLINSGGGSLLRTILRSRERNPLPLGEGGAKRRVRAQASRKS